MSDEIGKSRNEAIMENILGEDNEILDPVSRNEVLLQEIANYLEDTPSEVISSNEIDGIINTVN